MYSGTTFKPMQRFDAWFGAHQKIDRVARDHLGVLLPDSRFPSRKLIVKFEGLDGPDGIKRKTPAKDEPWHYYDPKDPKDLQIIEIITAHHKELAKALKLGDQTKAAFEAAWLAHAIVDGLTPAHHYPYEEELVKLRGQGSETRNSPKEQVIIPGETLPKLVSNNWKMWGDKGLLATHFAFEWGVAVMILPLRLGKAYPTTEDTAWVAQHGVAELFASRAKQIYDMKIYEQFYKSAWTPRLAKQVRKELVPVIINTVTLAWYAAAVQAGNQ